MFDNPYVRSLIIGGAVFAVILGLKQMTARQPARHSGAAGGRITPNKPLIAVVTLIGLALGTAALYAAITSGGGVPATLVGIAALAMSAATATSLTAIYDIRWTPEGVEGPSSLLFPPIGPKRITMAWDDVAEAGQDAGGNWYVADVDGRRIRWNFVYSGYPALMHQVEKACPWVFAGTDPTPEAPD